jgi:hypothetical protein
MSTQPAPIGPHFVHSEAGKPCPPWCAMRHDSSAGEGAHVHVSGARMVKGTVLRLAASSHPGTGGQDSPVVYVGEEEYTLHEAEVLIDALVELVDEGIHGTEPSAEQRHSREHTLTPPASNRPRRRSP